MERRKFIKTSVLASSGIFFIDSFLGCVNPLLGDKQMDDYFKGFQNPPVNSRLFVRWWWNGNRLDKNEILRELDIMKAAGIGGVEINPIAFPADTDPVGYKAMTIFDDEWLEMLKVALEGAKERGLACDMIVGSGWPFGGEFLKKDQQTQLVTIETIDLRGGQEYRVNVNELLEKINLNVHSTSNKVYKDLLMIRLLPKRSARFIEGKELLPAVKDGILEVTIPEGDFVLYCVVKFTGYMSVINGAPGAAGPVLNHYSKEATETYFNRVSELITSKIGDMGNYIRAMFCDSMELEGANWNDDLPDEFEKRRGYSLIPYLPFVLKKVGQMGNPLNEEYGIKFSEEVLEDIRRVDLDYYQTRMELFKERFIDTFNAWCHRNNVKSRMQAYGRGMHPVEASMGIDIPECETWAFKEVGREYPNTGLTGRAPRMSNKYVASGAALAGKSEVSCEEITNTEMVFMATLENIKIIGDQSNISGVNHSVLHGFNYSPPEAVFPGWIRYGTYFSERNPWWPYFRKWSDYKARVSYVFQNAIPQANVAILPPLIDLWLKHGPQRDPFPEKWYPDYQHNLWEAINQNGGGCDVVSENIIQHSTFNNGKMIYNGRSYSVILMPEIETLDISTANALVDFANTGGKIVFIEKTPFKSPAFLGNDEKDNELKQIIDKLLEDQPENVVRYPAPDGDLIKWYGKMQEELKLKPYVKFKSTHKYLSQSNYLLGDSPVFFITNTSLSEHISVTAEFQVDDNLYPWVWNPETGEKSLHPTSENEKTLALELPRATSLLIVFEKESDGDQYLPIGNNMSGFEVTGSWHLHLNHINGEKKSLKIDALIDLVKDDRTKNFAGQVIYEKSILIESKVYERIDLGDVQGVSELTINGQMIGVRWYGGHVYDIKGALKKGKNEISIKLTTIVGNYMKGLKDNKVAQTWTANQEYYPMGIIGPIRFISVEG